MTQVLTQGKNQMQFQGKDQMILQAKDQRRHDIDWLRTLAFVLLILYHVGMYYVADWDWHIKSSQHSVWLQDLMILTNQWRMSLLFFISGIALAMVYGKYTAWQLVALRSNRLLVPLVFGMLVIVPPQLYYELVTGHYFAGSYLTFMQQYLNVHTELAPHKQSAIGLITWNHLWFIPYLWAYSVLMLVFYPVLKRMLAGLATRAIPLWLAFIVLVVLFAVIWLQLRERFPITHALLNDWYNHAKYFAVFIAGMALVNLPRVWQQIIDKRRVMAVLAIAGYLWLLLDRHGYLDVGDQLDKLLVIKFAHGLLLSINHWAWILAVVGYAGQYLNFSNRFLRYANQAILPWYILHQSLIILFAMALLKFNLPAYIEAPLLICATSLGCILGYELVRRFGLSRWLFGLKKNNPVVAAKPIPLAL